MSHYSTVNVCVNAHTCTAYFIDQQIVAKFEDHLDPWTKISGRYDLLNFGHPKSIGIEEAIFIIDTSRGSSAEVWNLDNHTKRILDISYMYDSIYVYGLYIVDADFCKTQSSTSFTTVIATTSSTTTTTIINSSFPNSSKFIFDFLTSISKFGVYACPSKSQKN